MLKKITACLMAIVMLGTMTACSSKTEKTEGAQAQSSNTSSSPAGTAKGDGDPALEETYTLIFSHENAESSFIHQVCLQLKDKVEAATNGHVIIDIYPNSQLGSKTDNWQAISDNTVQMLLGVGSHMDQRFSLLTIPSLYSSVDECYEAFGPDTELFQAIEEIGEEVGIKVLLEVPIGFRTFSTNVETRNFGDIAGQDVRVMEMNEYITLWKAFGANPTPIAFSELYLALQQGLVDAQENPLDVIVTNKLYEQQKYVVLTNHEPFFYGLCMNLQAWNALPQAYQDAITEVVEEIRTIAYEGGKESEAAATQTLKDAGVTIVELSDEDYAKMQEACEGSVYELYRSLVGDELFELALKTAESVKK